MVDASITYVTGCVDFTACFLVASSSPNVKKYIKMFNNAMHVGKRFIPGLGALCVVCVVCVTTRFAVAQPVGGRPGGGGGSPGGGPGLVPGLSGGRMPGGFGGPQGGPGGGVGNANAEPCATDGSSARVSASMNGDIITIEASGCPPYDWSSQSTPGYAGQLNLVASVPKNPTLSRNPIYLNENGGIKGPIGLTTYGVPLFNALDADGRNAYQYEGPTFDQCNGHAAGTQYHHHTAPRSKCCVPGALDEHDDDDEKMSARFFAIMPDGIPVAWPDKTVEVDECNGAYNVDLGFYHYYATMEYPYGPNCLRGCVLSSFGLSDAISSRSGTCEPSETQYDYSSLHDGGLLTWNATPVDSLATYECPQGDYSLTY